MPSDPLELTVGVVVADTQTVELARALTYLAKLGASTTAHEIIALAWALDIAIRRDLLRMLEDAPTALTEQQTMFADMLAGMSDSIRSADVPHMKKLVTTPFAPSPRRAQ